MKIKAVKLNHQFKIKITFNNSNQEYIIDFSSHLKYPAYALLNDLSLFLNAKFDDDVIFWDSNIDIHIDQLIELIKSQVYEMNDNSKWIKLKKYSYYEYSLHNWSYP